MNEILREVMKQKEIMRKSFKFNLWSKDHQSIFMQGYESSIEVIINLLKEKLDNDVIVENHAEEKKDGK